MPAARSLLKPLDVHRASTQRFHQPVSCTDPRPDVHFWLITDRGEIRVPSGRSVLGRSMRCEICIADDHEVSRRHCVFLVEEGSLLLQDLDSANGTYVNGEAITGSVRLFGGEVVRAGERHFQVGVGSTPPKLCVATKPDPPAQASASATDVSDLTPTATSSGVSAFLIAATRGRTPSGEELEPDVLEPMLVMVREEVNQRGDIELNILRHAAVTALALAVSGNDAPWVSYAVDLFVALRRPMPNDVLEALEIAVWHVNGIDPEPLAHYARVLADALDPLDTAGQAVRLRIEEQARAVKSQRSRSSPEQPV